jgi:hypothetical protein
MTITIDISPAKEKQLKELAARAGVPVPEYVRTLVEDTIPATVLPEPQNEWERQLIDFSRRHRSAGPHLSDEDLRRENIYEDAD